MPIVKKHPPGKNREYYVGDSQMCEIVFVSESGPPPRKQIVRIPIDADAIRESGIRCETCEHWGQFEALVDGINVVFHDCEHSLGGGEENPDFFCAHHSALQPEGE